MAPLTAPSPVPYQGSKRKIASKILRWFPDEIDVLYEPFAGSAAVTLAAAIGGLAAGFVIADSLQPLAKVWEAIIERPDELSASYAELWDDQLQDPRNYFDKVRSDYNKNPQPAPLLYLICRCVKNAVRFNPRGEFNQSPDNRRLGMRPLKMSKEIAKAHLVLGGRSIAAHSDYRAAITPATPRDLVYMDPPYQGVSDGRDKRYHQGVDRQEFVVELNALNARGIPYIVSYDGYLGHKSYGVELPSELGLTRVLVPAGRSSQSTLLGRSETTIESLYLSPSLTAKLSDSNKSALGDYQSHQPMLMTI